jgi:hypothetical protein
MNHDGGWRPRILLHSQRNIYRSLHFRLGLYEFEDIIREVDEVDLVAPQPERWFGYGTRIANRLARTVHTTVNPGIPTTRVNRDYDLFVAVVQFPRDLLHVKYLEGWRDRCKTSICWLNELWISYIARTGYFLELLSQFDHVILQQAGSVGPVQKVINKPCVYLPAGIDALRFSPYPGPPQRVVDVYSIGRRSNETHRALLEMAREKKIFYVYDTIEGQQVIDPEEHRALYADTAKRSRYFIVNPGKADKREEAGEQVEFGNRFFEGAAAGTILIGETPKNDAFPKVFNWPDAVIDLPFHSDQIEGLISELDQQPERQTRIRQRNIMESLLQHDWAYRWESTLAVAGLDPLPGLAARKRRLAEMASCVANQAAAC